MTFFLIRSKKIEKNKVLWESFYQIKMSVEAWSYVGPVNNTQETINFRWTRWLDSKPDGFIYAKFTFSEVLCSSREGFAHNVK